MNKHNLVDRGRISSKDLRKELPILFYQELLKKGFIDSQFNIKGPFLDIGRGECMLCLQEGEMRILKQMKKEELIEEPNEQFSISSKSLSREYIRRLAFPHQSIVKLIGWGEFEDKLFYIYEYHETTLDFYIENTDISLKVFTEIKNLLFEALIYLNSNDLHLGSDRVYIGNNSTPVFGEEIIDEFVIKKSQVYFKRFLKGRRDCKPILKKMKSEFEYLINIFKKFESISTEIDQIITQIVGLISAIANEVDSLVSSLKISYQVKEKSTEVISQPENQDKQILEELKSKTLGIYEQIIEINTL